MPRARYKQLVDQLAADIRRGALAPGTRLPTHRELAAQHGIALVTASRVYTELHAMGLVSGETGRGTFVRETSLAPITDLMARQFHQQPGNYLAFFSSYAYLEQALDNFRRAHPDIPVWAQSRSMNEAERQDFLERFTEHSRGVGFAVLGALVHMVWDHKLWWMVPLLVALLLLGALLFVQSTPVGPLIYPVF